MRAGIAHPVRGKRYAARGMGRAAILRMAPSHALLLGDIRVGDDFGPLGALGRNMRVEISL